MIKHTSCKFTSVISDARQNLKKIPNMYPSLVPARLQHIKNNKLNLLADVPYDFTEIYRAVDTEAFLSTTMRKKILLILKGGYNFVSKEQKNIDYIKKRIVEMEYVTEKFFEDLLLEIVTSLIFNHNAYLYKVRNSNSSSGNKRRNLEPLAGVYVLPEYKIRINKDNYEQVDSYQYNVNHMISKKIKKDIIYHYTIDKKPGMLYGTPPFEALRDDVLSLRQIEESLERLIYKLASPLIHMIVGTEAKPASYDRLSGRPETEIYNDLMLDMDDTGGITTSERVQIKMIGAESHALRLESPIRHYVNRILVGLNISEVDLGIGNSTTGGAAEVISYSLKQNIEMYQYLIENMINNTIINTFLLESNRYKNQDYVPLDERVYFKFEKADLDLKIKAESHLMQEVNAQVITRNEYRTATGRPDFTKEQLNEFIEEANRDIESSSLLAQNVLEPENQFSDSLIKRADEYLYLLQNNKTELANEVLYLDIKDQLSSFDMNFNIDSELHSSISSLTTTLQKYIMNKVPSTIISKTINKVLNEILTDLISKT